MYTANDYTVVRSVRVWFFSWHSVCLSLIWYFNGLTVFVRVPIRFIVRICLYASLFVVFVVRCLRYALKHIRRYARLSSVVCLCMFVTCRCLKQTAGAAPRSANESVSRTCVCAAFVCCFRWSTWPSYVISVLHRLHDDPHFYLY